MHVNSMFAQTTDFGTWTTLELNHSFTKDLSARFSQQLRLEQGSEVFKSTFSDLGLSYKINKHWSVAGDYRLITTPLDLQHRFYADATYSKKFHKLSLNTRLRYQKQFEVANFPVNYIRPKLSLKYKINKQIVPYTAFESGYRIFYKGNRFDFYRIYLGTSIDLNKMMSVDLYYLFTTEINVTNPGTNHIAGFTLAFDL